MSARQPARQVVQRTIEPWAACEVTQYTALAVRAMHAGNASGDQQKSFMVWLNTIASPLIGIGWSPDDERISSFLAGRRFVALKIAEILKTNPDFYNQKGTDK